MARFDRWVTSPFTLAAAFVWGLAEATFFFIVPDVLLTLIACRSLRAATRAGVAALVGALVGGAIMMSIARHDPAAVRAWLDRVPAITPALIETVRNALDRDGLVAVLLGPLRGAPYKVYAAEWGIRGGDLTAFLMMSIPARGLRFLMSVLVAAGAAVLLRRRTGRDSAAVASWAVVWAAIYAAYFHTMGW